MMRGFVILALVAGCGTSIEPVDAPADAPALGCDPFQRCTVEGATCTLETQRCTCETGAGLTWFCEPIECDPGPATVGAPCSTPGLRCDSGFEHVGNVCVHGAWTQCSAVRWDGSDRRPWCPATPPDESSRCCVVSASSVPDHCPYETATYRCIDHRWAVVTM